MEHHDETVTEAEGIVDLAGQVRDITVSGLPDGYDYKATRYADVILKEAFSNRFRDLTKALEQFEPTLDELRSGGGGRTVFVRRFDESLGEQLEEEKAVWGKQNITIDKGIGFDGNMMPDVYHPLGQAGPESQLGRRRRIPAAAHRDPPREN